MQEKCVHKHQKKKKTEKNTLGLQNVYGVGVECDGLT